MADETKENNAIEKPVEIAPENKELIRPQSVTSIDDLAKLERGQGAAIAEQKELILNTYRLGSIRMTRPTDWLLFRDDAGNETAYLQDCGCERIMGYWGIEVNNVRGPETIKDPESEEWGLLFTGDGYCRVTQKGTENVEGWRQSSDDFVKYDKGITRAMKIRKAARANLDGSITRELAGLSRVPLADLIAVYGQGVYNTIPKGRGYGTKAERMGAQQSEGGLEAPSCPKCGGPMRLKKGKTTGEKSYPDFWGCKKYPKCDGTAQVNGNGGQSREQNGGQASKSNSGIEESAGMSSNKNALMQAIDAANLAEGKRLELRKMVLGAKNFNNLLDAQTALDDAVKS